MARYFFDIVHSDNRPIPDDEGGEFEDLEAAKLEAIASIRDIVAEAIKNRRKVTGMRIEVRDEAGTLLTSVGAKDVFD